LEQSLACYQSVKNQRFLSNVIINLANLAWLQEDYTEAVRRCEQVLAMSRESDSRDLITSAESFLGIIEWTRGNFELAKQKGQKALLNGQEWKDYQLMTSSYFLLGGVALYQGDLLEAETNFRSLVEISHGEGIGPPGLSYLLSLLAVFQAQVSWKGGGIV
jgi:tetratricopeptide (TPR) repeat protein